ncbi:MAG: HlyD family efflux transporter periplasmic adaptor subunit [Gemmatimonadales bacterium]|jgi:HlyD family secretion protein|nr:MAG: HlyD family efflux transporter periplasmic adaptor subunit [Gemmatimonadales bacterium]
MKIGRRHLVGGGLLALVAVALLLVLRPEALDVEVAQVDRGPLRVTVDEDGETRVKERFILSAPVTGRLERLQCEVGDTVVAGEVLARIYPLPLDSRASREAEERLESAEASWRAADARERRAETSWGEAVRALERLQQVRRGAPGAVTEQRMDQARTLERAAHLALEQAREETVAASHAREAARAALLGSGDEEGEPTLLRTPADGRVLRLYEECERPVTAGSPVLEIGDPSELEVVVEVLTEDAVRLRPGAAAHVTSGLGADTLRGLIVRIEPSAFTRVSPLGVEEQRVNVVVALDASATVLGDRFRVDVALVEWEEEEVVRVPSSALFRVDAGWGVFTVTDGLARLRRIELGRQGRRQAELLEGLEVGESVILYPSDEVEDGVRVRVEAVG